MRIVGIASTKRLSSIAIAITEWKDKNGGKLSANKDRDLPRLARNRDSSSSERKEHSQTDALGNFRPTDDYVEILESRMRVCSKS